VPDHRWPRRKSDDAVVNVRSANLSWAPPFNEAEVSISHYIIHVRKGETGDWDQTVDTETNSTFFQVSSS
jgi:hypothetical protein